MPDPARLMSRFTMRRSPAEGFDRAGWRLVRTWRDPEDRVCAEGYAEDGVRWMRWPCIATFRCDPSGAVDGFPEAGIDPSRVIDLYNRTVQALALQALGYETLHASAVRAGDGIVAFCGDREVGKSTIAYALAERGYQQVADDTLVVEPAAGITRVVELPFLPRLRPEAASFFGTLVEQASSSSSSPAANSTLAAVVVLSRTTDGPPVIRRLQGGDALTAILAHAHCFEPDDPLTRRRVLEHYLEMAAAVPVYSLRFSPGLAGLRLVLDHIAQVVAAPAVEYA